LFCWYWWNCWPSLFNHLWTVMVNSSTNISKTNNYQQTEFLNLVDTLWSPPHLLPVPKQDLDFHQFFCHFLFNFDRLTVDRKILYSWVWWNCKPCFFFSVFLFIYGYKSTFSKTVTVLMVLNHILGLNTYISIL
jgi:hypothetical protein